MMSRFTSAPAFCGCCLAPSRGRGFFRITSARGHFKCGPSMWFCEHEDCIAAMERAYDMAEDAFAAHLTAALDVASKTAGRWLLEDKGETDLAKLDFDDYQAFCRKLVEGVSDELRRRMTRPVKP